jgi:hypothetical protein
VLSYDYNHGPIHHSLLGGRLNGAQVGQILKVALSIASIPHAKKHPLIHSPFPDYDIPIQFAKVQGKRIPKSIVGDGARFPPNNLSNCDGWQ